MSKRRNQLQSQQTVKNPKTNEVITVSPVVLRFIKDTIETHMQTIGTGASEVASDISSRPYTGKSPNIQMGVKFNDDGQVSIIKNAEGRDIINFTGEFSQFSDNMAELMNKVASEYLECINDAILKKATQSKDEMTKKLSAAPAA